MTSRRDFLKQAALGAAGVAVSSMPSFSAKSYANVKGANERIRIGAVGVNSRGAALAQNFAKMSDCSIDYICDVDSRALDRCVASIEKQTGKKPKGEEDLRRLYEKKDLDAVIIATPDHWHASAALMAMQAGKDVYLEKPVAYAPAEGEMLIKGAAKYGRVLQVGSQRRSWPNVIEAINLVKSGEIGEVHFGKCWYTNRRASIGHGQVVEPPKELNWDLWQGPAPRTEYRSNLVHYNWHWFWHWGTAESLNNGMHMIDLLRWGMGVDYPTMVQSTGGRYYYEDDWQTPDTQLINLDFGGEKSMLWEGHSCNPHRIEGESVGVLFYGEKADLLIGGGNSYKIFDKRSRVIKEKQSEVKIDPRNPMNPAQALDSIHIQNFFDGIKKGTKLNADITTGHISTLLMQLGNIALRTNSTLKVDPTDGHIIGNKAAQKLWSRKYEKGWEMKL